MPAERAFIAAITNPEAVVIPKSGAGSGYKVTENDKISSLSPLEIAITYGKSWAVEKLLESESNHSALQGSALPVPLLRTAITVWDDVNKDDMKNKFKLVLNKAVDVALVSLGKSPQFKDVSHKDKAQILFDKKIQLLQLAQVEAHNVNNVRAKNIIGAMILELGVTPPIAIKTKQAPSVFPPPIGAPTVLPTPVPQPLAPPALISAAPAFPPPPKLSTGPAPAPAIIPPPPAPLPTSPVLPAPIFPASSPATPAFPPPPSAVSTGPAPAAPANMPPPPPPLVTLVSPQIAAVPAPLAKSNSAPNLLAPPLSPVEDLAGPPLAPRSAQQIALTPAAQAAVAGVVSPNQQAAAGESTARQKAAVEKEGEGKT